MPVKTNVAKFEIKNVTEEVRNLAVTAVPLNISNNDSDPENVAAIENENSSSRYSIIKNQSLNPLKPIVIGNTEFVHVGSGEDPDSSGLKAQFGENNIVSVNSVIKLFEIQRMIREAGLKNATFLLDVAKGYDNRLIMSDTKRKMKEIFDDVINDDINVTIDNFIEKAKLRLTLSRKFKKDEDKDEGSDGQSGFAGARQAQPGEFNFEVGRRNSTRLKSVAEQNGEDPYFRALVEYVAYNTIVFEAIKYLSGILRIKDDALNFWSVLESTSETAMKDIEIETRNQELRDFLERSNIYSVGAHNANTSANERISAVMNFMPSTDTPDTTMLLQNFVSTFDQVLIKKCFNKSSTPHEKIRIDGQSLKMTNAGNSPVQKALLELQKSWLIGLYNDSGLLDYPYNNSPYSGLDDAESSISSLTGGSDDLFEASTQDIVKNVLTEPSVDGGFGEEKLEKIISFFPEAMDDTSVYGELLSAVLFNDGLDAAGETSDTISRSLTTLGMGGTTKNIFDYFFKLLGNQMYSQIAGDFDGSTFTGNRAEPRVGTLIDFDPEGPGVNEDSALLSSYVGFKNSSEFKYAPFESTRNLESSGYVTGPEFFIDIALQQGDNDLSAFETFTSQYKIFSQQYALDVDKRTRLGDIEAGFIDLMNEIGESLLTVSGNYRENMLRIGMLVKFARSRKNLIAAYKSAYLGEKVSSFNPGEAKAYGDPFMEEKSEYQKTDSSSKRTRPIRGKSKSRARATVVKSDKLLTKFVRDTLNVKDLKFGGPGGSKSDNDRFTSLGLTSGHQVDHVKCLYAKEYCEKDDDFDRINGIKEINAGTGENQSNKKIYKIYKQYKPKAGGDELNQEHQKLRRGLRVGGDFMNYFLQNKHFDKNIFQGDVASRNSFNQKRPGMLRGRVVNEEDMFRGENSPSMKDFDNTFPYTINRQGSAYGLSEHHRAFVLYAFVAKVLQESISVKADSRNPTNSKGKNVASNDAYIQIIGNKDEMRGVAYAFKDFRQKTGGVRSHPGEPQSFRTAYTNTLSRISEVFLSLRRRCDSLEQHAIVPLIHAQMLDNFRKKSQSYIRGGDGSKKSRAAINLLKNNNIQAFNDTLGLISEESVSDMFNTYVNTFVNKKDTIFTPEDVVDSKSAKLMMKILSNPGYGLLSSEEKGNTVVTHVGLTNSMMSVMRYDAYRKTRNKGFLNSKRFCVNIFKRNEIDNLEVVYPKTFLFDSKLQIHDYDHLGEPLNHIANYSDSWGFPHIIKNMEFTSWTDFKGDASSDTRMKTDTFRAFRNTGEQLLEGFQGFGNKEFDVSEDLLINHIYDYALKKYYKYSIGVDLETYSFVLDGNEIDFERAAGGFAGDPLETRENFDELITQIISAYPAANIDQVLASELFRSIKTIGASPIYSLSEKTKRVLMPKKFDRVISIPYCEKDFILYTPAYDVEFEDLYKTSPNFSYTSRLSRPALKHKGFQNEFSTVSRDSTKDITEKYKDNCRQDFPEISSTYVTITILPNGAS